MNILAWENVKEQLANLPDNSVLLGNGFSISYKSDDFNQKAIIKEMLSLGKDSKVEDIEECIKASQSLVSEGNSKTVSKNIIDIWIKEHIRNDFIEQLFKKCLQQ